jgi:hypothetical protein
MNNLIIIYKMNMQKTFFDQFVECHMNILEKILVDIQKKYEINDSEFISNYLNKINNNKKNK